MKRNSCRAILASLSLLLVFAGACSNNNGPTAVANPITPPAAASGLYAARTSPTRITLRWRDNSDNEIGFQIQRRTVAETAFAALPDTTPANRANFADSYQIQEGQTYVYRVVAYRLGAEAAPSNEVTVEAVTDQPPTAPSDPEPPDGAVELDPTAAVTLRWDSQDPDGDPLTYDVYFGPTLSTMRLMSAGQTENSFPLSETFERNNHYFWRIVVHTPKGVSTPSRLFGFNTVVDRMTVPAGQFFMGDTLQTLPGESGATNPLWFPDNPVEVGAFNMDKYEVSNQQYSDFLNQKLFRKELKIVAGVVQDAGGDFIYAEIYPTDLDSDITFSVQDSAFIVRTGREKFPAVEVSYYGAEAYASFYGRSLPTEAEWEKAARGASRAYGFRVFGAGDTLGVGFPLPWGIEPDLNRANVLNSGDPYENRGRVRSTPVGFYDTGESEQIVQSGYTVRSGASPYGIEDMAGNVWEWTSTFYRGPYSNPQETPHYPILRGGSYNEPMGSALTWNRTYLDPSTTDRAFGFRTVGH